MANTISRYTWTREAKAATMQDFLRSMLVAKEISDFKEGVKYIDNPYSSDAAVTTNTPMTGAYTVSDITTTDDQLLVNTEEIYSYHIADFEKVFSDFDLGSDQLRRGAYALAKKVDTALLTELSANAGNTVAVAGGFAVATVPAKIAEISSHFLGYDAVYGHYLVIDNTQTAAFIEAGATNGFSFADATLNNGMFGRIMGVDIYVVRAGVLPAGTAVAGVKRASTTGIGGAIKIEEKAVSGKTGMEFAAISYHTSKLWENNKPLVVNVNLA